MAILVVFSFSLVWPIHFHFLRSGFEALLRVLGIQGIWVQNYRDTEYLGEKLTGYGIFKQEIQGYQT